jgi:tRNA pseudouridine55 synthase
LNGLLNLLKPPGLTSHDCVSVIRRLLDMKRVGHAGTLDPGAAGVLLVFIGRATRISEFLMDADKAYRVEARLGVATTTGDAFGEVVATRTAEDVTREDVEAALAPFRGPSLQRPPMVSALHHQGERLYDLARRGVEVAREPRPIRIDLLRLARFDPPRLVLEVVCSKGTYVRQLCVDLGDALGCGAHAAFMVRTRVGVHRLEDSLTFGEIKARRAAGAPLLTSASEALPHLPEVDISAVQRAAVIRGEALPAWKVAPHMRLDPDAVVKLVDEDGDLVALARARGGRLRPFKVLAGP